VIGAVLLMGLSACVNTPPASVALDVYTRTIRAASVEAGTSMNLIPPFREGMRKSDVESVLKRSGYRLINTGIAAPVPGQPSLGVWQKELQTHAVDGAPCVARYGITVHFDAADDLMAAEGHWSDGGCG
jgi:hypothetical protein